MRLRWTHASICAKHVHTRQAMEAGVPRARETRKRVVARASCYAGGHCGVGVPLALPVLDVPWLAGFCLALLAAPFTR
jgi:hypothetical protein